MRGPWAQPPAQNITINKKFLKKNRLNIVWTYAKKYIEFWKKKLRQLFVYLYNFLFRMLKKSYRWLFFLGGGRFWRSLTRKNPVIKHKILFIMISFNANQTVDPHETKDITGKRMNFVWYTKNFSQKLV